MDNETRQYGAQGSEPPRPERPKQYFPDQSQNQQQYAQPAYEQPYQEPYYEPEPKGSSAGAIALGVVAALSFLSALVLFFLWLSLIHISEPTRLHKVSRMPSSA